MSASVASAHPLRPIWAIVVAGGSGERFGAPKQFEPLGGMRVLDWAVAAAREACDGVVLVLPAELVDGSRSAADAVVAGAESRSGSVRAGLGAVPPDAAMVLVHDAARPLASAALFAAVIAAVDAGADAALPGVPVADTLRRRDGDRANVDRAELVAVQTPQAFRADVLRSAHEGGPEATDDASLVDERGGHVVVVPGEARNRKITEPDDLVVARALLEAGRR